MYIISENVYLLWYYHKLSGELQNALLTFSGSEDMQVMWVANECDIKEIIENGTAPKTDYRSGGIMLMWYYAPLCINSMC